MALVSLEDLLESGTLLSLTGGPCLVIYTEPPRPKAHLVICDSGLRAPSSQSSGSTCARSRARSHGRHLDGRQHRRPPPTPGPRSRGRLAISAIRCRCDPVPRPAGAARASGERRAGSCSAAGRGCIRRRWRRGAEGANGAALQCPHHWLNER